MESSSKDIARARFKDRRCESPRSPLRIRFSSTSSRALNVVHHLMGAEGCPLSCHSHRDSPFFPSPRAVRESVRQWSEFPLALPRPNPRLRRRFFPSAGPAAATDAAEEGDEQPKVQGAEAEGGVEPRRRQHRRLRSMPSAVSPRGGEDNSDTTTTTGPPTTTTATATTAGGPASRGPTARTSKRCSRSATSPRSPDNTRGRT